MHKNQCLGSSLWFSRAKLRTSQRSLSALKKTRWGLTWGGNAWAQVLRSWGHTIPLSASFHTYTADDCREMGPWPGCLQLVFLDPPEQMTEENGLCWDVSLKLALTGDLPGDRNLGMDQVPEKTEQYPESQSSQMKETNQNVLSQSYISKGKYIIIIII